MPSELRVDKISSTTSPYDPVFSTTGGALSHRNVVINGAMQVAQRATSATGIGASNGYFTVDRFNLDNGGLAGRLTMSQDSDSPNGFGKSLKFDCTTADTSIGSGEYCILSTRLEGQDVQRFAKGTSNAKPFMVSFYVKGNANATYVCELYDGDNNRQISKTFSVTTSWTRVELAFPADTTGTFDDDSNVSLYLQIWLHGGSNYTSGTLNSGAWASNVSANRAVGITSFFDSTDRTFFLTGVQLELGSVATPFEHRSYADELRRCMRYFQRPEFRQAVFGGSAQIRSVTSECFIGYSLPVRMRVAPHTINTPTIGQSNGNFTFLVGEAYPGTHGSVSNTEASPDHIGFFFSGFSSLGTTYTNTWAYVTNNSGNNNAFFEFDAEL